MLITTPPRNYRFNPHNFYFLMKRTSFEIIANSKTLTRNQSLSTTPTMILFIVKKKKKLAAHHISVVTFSAKTSTAQRRRRRYANSSNRLCFLFLFLLYQYLHCSRFESALLFCVHITVVHVVFVGDCILETSSMFQDFYGVYLIIFFFSALTCSVSLSVLSLGNFFYSSGMYAIGWFHRVWIIWFLIIAVYGCMVNRSTVSSRRKKTMYSMGFNVSKKMNVCFGKFYLLLVHYFFAFFSGSILYMFLVFIVYTVILLIFCVFG